VHSFEGRHGPIRFGLELKTGQIVIVMSRPSPLFRPARPRHHHRGIDHDRLASCCHLETDITLRVLAWLLAWEGGLKICFQSPHDRLGAGPADGPYAS
jgi:hypothetical protein